MPVEGASVMEPHNANVKHFKVLIIGESGVGKSSMMLKFVDNIFTGIYISTIGVDFKSKIIEIGPYRCKVQIWDTAGQERFRVITSTYYRGADAIVLVYDVTDKRSFNKIDHWTSEIQNHCHQRSPIMILAGNKSDMECSKREVAFEQGQQLAQSIQIPFFETSAKDGTCIEQLFRSAAEMALDKHLCEQLSSEKNKRHRSGTHSLFSPISDLADKVFEKSFKLRKNDLKRHRSLKDSEKCCAG